MIYIIDLYYYTTKQLMKLKPYYLLVIFSLPFFNQCIYAQGKIGYISIPQLVRSMPEFAQATIDLDEYEKALIQVSNDNQAEFSRQDSIFKADSLKWNPAVKDVRRTELNTISVKMINFSREAEQLLNKREQELLAPIQQKALLTTQMVAKENGYSFVMSKEQLISFLVTDDLLPLVWKKLNIEPPPKK